MNWLLNAGKGAFTAMWAALLIGLAGCRPAATEAEEAPPTAWPTLAPVLLEDSGPATAPDAVQAELQDHFRAELREDAALVFPIYIEAEHPIRAEAVVLSGSPDPVIRVRDISGGEFVRLDSHGIGQAEVLGELLVPQTGYYELELSSLTGAGQVGVSVYRLVAAQVESGGQFTSTQQVLAGQINHPISFHTYRVRLERGQRVSIIGQAEQPALELFFTLYAPDGSPAAEAQASGGSPAALWNIVPDQSGAYTLVLGSRGGAVGAYSLAVDPGMPAQPAVLGSRTALTLGEGADSTAWLSLNGRAHDAVSLEVRPVETAAVDPIISIYDPYGNRLIAASSAGPGEAERVTFAQFHVSGEYQLAISSGGQPGGVEYLIREIREADAGMGGRTAPGAVPQDGEITGPGSAVSYSFEADAGQLIGLEARPVGRTNLDLMFELYSPDGYLLLARDDVAGLNPLADRFELPQAGRYTLILRAKGAGTGPFEMIFVDPDVPLTPPAEAE